MARYMRLDVVHEILDAGVLPLFYADEVDLAVGVINACRAGGVRAIEFTSDHSGISHLFNSWTPSRRFARGCTGPAPHREQIR
jgi:2-keto-3-deoxy-6-phosphogluconate aldolase